MTTTSMTAALLLLLVSAALVQGQGGEYTVKLSEADFASHENEGSLNITVTITSTGASPGPNQLEFSFEALTKPEYLERSNAPENALVCSDLIPQNNDLGGENELLQTSISCRTDPPIANAVSVTCSFPIRQDNIFERDEYLVIVMTVTDDGGNTVSIDRNCAIGRILQNDNPAEEVDFRLTTINGPLRVTEGETLDLEFTRQFDTELPILITVQGSGADNTFPVPGVDYSANTQNIVFPGNQTTLTIPIELIDDNDPEDVEVVNFALTAIVMLVGASTQVSIPIEPSTIMVSIFDDEVLVSGFDITENTITITEGEELVLSGELKTFDPLDPTSPFLSRSILLNLDTVDNTATVDMDYSITRPDERNIFNTFEPIRFTIHARADDDIPQPSRSFQAILVDEGLAALTDPDDIRRHREVNTISPGNITIIILDDDGTPNIPMVTFGVGPTFQWEADEEDQARPVDCYYGNVTVREPNNEEEVVEFDFCSSGSGPESEFDLPDFDDDNEYIVIVCSRNRLGDACTAPLTHTPPPFTTEVPMTKVPIATTSGSGMTGPQAGAIVGIVVGVLLGCCLLWLLLLLILLLCCCCGAREKRYFPQKREKMFAKQGHEHDARYSAEEFDTVKIPLD